MTTVRDNCYVRLTSADTIALRRDIARQRLEAFAFMPLVDVQRIDERVWHAALALADNDPYRLLVGTDGSVVVTNRPIRGSRFEINHKEK
jgi:hypothetical protein